MKREPERPKNLVKELRKPRGDGARLPRVGPLKLIAGAVGLTAIGGFTTDHRVRVAAFVVALFVVVGAAIAWLAGTAGHLSGSGREMRDFWKDDDGTAGRP